MEAANPTPSAPQPSSTAGPAAVGANPPDPRPAKPPPLFRRTDWLTFALVFLAAFAGYQYTLAPDVTLQDSGELAVGSFYAGVPHPPGYPVWTIYTWLATVLYPVSNVAYRVASACSLTSALACALLGLLVSRGSSMLIEGLSGLSGLERRLENAICVVSGFVAGCLLAYNGFYWSQSVIVEVYCFGVFSFMLSLCLLFRWLYAPHQFRYLYWASFVFGICFTNHQTLLVSTMGIEVLILLVSRPMGRDVFWFNTLVYLGLSLLDYFGLITTFDTNHPLFIIFNVIGIGSIYAALAATLTCGPLTQLKVLGGHLVGNVAILVLGMGKAVDPAAPDALPSLWLVLYNAVGAVAIHVYFWWKDQAASQSVLTLPVALCYNLWHRLVGQPQRLPAQWRALPIVLAWCLGAGMYFYLPITSMTNPPMNWAYPRIPEGFFHALTRGQYERTNPTSDPVRFVNQLRMYAEGAIEEFNAAYLALALVPFFFLSRLRPRERAWLLGLLAIWAFQGILLLILLNPSSDRQSRDLHKVFFNASFAILAIGLGYGLALVLSQLAADYARFRSRVLFGSAGAAALALYGLADVTWEVSNPLILRAQYFATALAAAAVLLLLLRRERAPMAPLLGLAFLMPLYSVMTHWADNEQRNHLFGFWFGHDMFTPPDFGRKGELYPEMARDAILFGGTDPGRFCPTYMIFCESFIPPEKRRDPKFDRRDVYIITQNALADGTYLNYIRGHYNRSRQIDAPFFQELLRSRQEIEKNETTNRVARWVAPLDRFFTSLGQRVEERRRREGVYPPKEICTPTPEESKQCFEAYIADAHQRKLAGRLKPGEIVTEANGRVAVSGQISVMQINGLLTKVIFDANPTHEFYLEESYPLDWMYPHLTPFGVIMKINRQPVPPFSEELLQRDHLFWSLYSERLIGNWITDQTSVKEICDFVERTYRRMDYRGFKGRREFVRDNDAQKAFSKLRGAQAGLYLWRLNNTLPKDSPEYRRLLKECEFAYKQAFAFCPYSPEAVVHYIVNLLVPQQCYEDAYLVATTCLKFDPEHVGVADIARQLAQIRQGVPVSATSTPNQVEQAEQELSRNPGNAALAQQLANTFLAAGHTNRAAQVLDRSIEFLRNRYQNNPTDYTAAQTLATLLNQRDRGPEAAQVLTNLVARLTPVVQTHPTDVEASFHLAQAYLGLHRADLAVKQIDALLELPGQSADFFVRAAQVYAQAGNMAQLENTLLRLVDLTPERPEVWYDLARTRGHLGKDALALESLAKALELHRQRLRVQPGGNDLSKMAAQDESFRALRSNAQFQTLLQKK